MLKLNKSINDSLTENNPVSRVSRMVQAATLSILLLTGCSDNEHQNSSTVNEIAINSSSLEQEKKIQEKLDIKHEQALLISNNINRTISEVAIAIEEIANIDIKYIKKTGDNGLIQKLITKHFTYLGSGTINLTNPDQMPYIPKYLGGEGKFVQNSNFARTFLEHIANKAKDGFPIDFKPITLENYEISIQDSNVDNYIITFTQGKNIYSFSINKKTNEVKINTITITLKERGL